MVDNKSKSSLIRHIQKNISLVKINNNNTRATHSYNIVIFIHDIFTSLHVIREVFLLCKSGSLWRTIATAVKGLLCDLRLLITRTPKVLFPEIFLHDCTLGYVFCFINFLSSNRILAFPVESDKRLSCIYIWCLNFITIFVIPVLF